MPKLWPFPITVGTDICHVKRIYDILTTGISAIKGRQENVKIKAKRFVHRVLTDREIHEAVSRGRLYLPLLEKREASSPEDLQRMSKMAKFLAGRFAAKEATMKAFPSLSLTFHDITVQTAKYGPDRTTTAPTAIIEVMEKDGLDMVPQPAQTVPLSISHDGEYATAVALGFDILATPMPTDQSTPQNPMHATKNMVLGSMDTNPLEQSPTLIKSTKPMLGVYTVFIDRLSTQIDNFALLDLFRQQYSSVRWVMVKQHTYEENGKEFGSGFVTFGFRAEADRAIKEANGLIVMGQSIVAVRAARNMIGKRVEHGGVWLYNDQLDREDQPSSEVQEQEYPTKSTQVSSLSPLTKVYQDGPVITTTNPNSGIDGFSSWNTEEIIQSDTWDSIQGESVHPQELSDLMTKVMNQEEKKRKICRRT